jgi:MscS family membrane protein
MLDATSMNAPRTCASRPLRTAACLGFGLVAGTLAPWPASAASTGGPPAADSPRAAIGDYLELCRAGDYESAARYLAGTPGDPRRAEQARRLKAVLDRHLWVELESLSPDPGGNADDALPSGVDEVGTIAAAGGRVPVRIVRTPDGQPPYWTFAPEAVARVDRWYAQLGDRWLRDRLPDALLRPGPLDLAWWQWAALPLVAVLGWSLGRLLGWVALRSVTRLASRTHVNWDDALVASVTGPVVLAFTVAAWYPLTRALDLYPPMHAFVTQSLGTLLLLAFFWGLWRGVGVVGHALRRADWAAGNAGAQSALSIGVRLGRVAVLCVAVVAALSRLGYPVTGLLAGLGLGGLAFALAAQKTVENLFGSLSIAVDAPFRVGDFVKVEDVVGTVETLGLRSTRIRTLDRTLVTIPNGRLAEMRLESYSVRDRLRLACTISLVYDTSADQMRRVLEGLEAALRAHPLIWPDAVVVRFKELGPCSLDIEVMAWFLTSDWPEFQLIRQEMLLRFMQVVEGAGSSFAFPTRTVHVSGVIA